MRERVLVLLGPTACGKTGLGISLAKKLGGEILSADSVAVYRGMQIGSARPSIEEQDGVAHHLLDCISVDDRTFSVAQYRELALCAIRDICSRGHLPIVVGGSGLYLDAITSPMTYVTASDPVLREELNCRYSNDPLAFCAQLRACDPISADRLHPNDKKRIVRAMEVYELTGAPLSAHISCYARQQGSGGDFMCRKYGIDIARDLLYKRIDMRVDEMIQSGLEAEARAIYDLGLPRDLPALHSIGYAQLFSYFDGDMSFSDAVSLIKTRTRQFAKRQCTWFRRDAGIVWMQSNGRDKEWLTDTIIQEWEAYHHA